MGIPQAQQHGRGDTEGAAGKAQEKAQEVATQAKEQVQQKAQDLKGQASEQMRSRLDSGSTQLGEHVGSFGQALRKAGQNLRGEGNETGAKAAHKAADHADRLAGYLKNSSADRFLGDVETFARRRPWVAGGIGAAAGFLASRFLKASSEGRYATSRRSSVDSDAALRRDPDATYALPPETRSATPSTPATDPWSR